MLISGWSFSVAVADAQVNQWVAWQCTCRWNLVSQGLIFFFNFLPFARGFHVSQRLAFALASVFLPILEASGVSVRVVFPAFDFGIYSLGAKSKKRPSKRILLHPLLYLT